MSEYCDESDLYDYGLPRGAIPNPARLAASALAATDQITLDGHGFAEGDAVTLRADVGAGSALPAPLASGVAYYAIPDTDQAFRLAATPGGAAIDLTTDGAQVLVVAKSPVRSVIRGVSAWINDTLPAHIVPLTDPIPEIVRMTCAELVTWKLQARSGVRSETFSEVTKEARIRLEKWARHVPIRGENAPAAASLSTSTVPRQDARGWGRYGGIG